MPASMPAKEVPELPVHPRALRHVGHGEAPLLREDGVLDAVLFGEGKVLLRGEAAVSSSPGEASCRTMPRAGRGGTGSDRCQRGCPAR